MREAYAAVARRVDTPRYLDIDARHRKGTPFSYIILDKNEWISSLFHPFDLQASEGVARYVIDGHMPLSALPQWD